MIIKWKNVQNIYEYVSRTLIKEADDIPLDEINKGIWFLDELNINKIKVNQNMITDHNKDSLHIRRKNNFVKLIKDEKEIFPLIVIGEELFLVDGYARYRALKAVGIDKVQVFRQRFS